MAIKELKSLTFGDGDTYVPAPTNWEEIPDKPFGVIGKGDTLTWDCKENNPYTNDITYWWTRLYKVSDAIITEEDLQNGAITTFTDEFGQQEYQMTCTYENGLIWNNDDGAIFIARELLPLDYGWRMRCPPPLPDIMRKP